MTVKTWRAVNWFFENVWRFFYFFLVSIRTQISERFHTLNEVLRNEDKGHARIKWTTNERLREKGQGWLGWRGVEVMLIGINNRAHHYNRMEMGRCDENMNGWQLKNKWPMNSTTFRSTVSLGNGINTLEFCQFRHRHTTSLHGDLGHVIFGQDIHAVWVFVQPWSSIKRKRLQQVWLPNENWRYGAIEGQDRFPLPR